MRWYIILTILFLHTSYQCLSQKGELQAVSGLPSKEVYQILIDKKGYVWVAHELGISKYDGIKFTTYTHPEQIGLSLFDLFEDNQGRIWCHNINNQIFFLENNKINYLSNYKDIGTKIYPQVAKLNNEIIINSSTGIYVQNTIAQKGRHITNTIDGKPIGSTYSFCAFNDSLMVIKASNKWFFYQQGKGVLNLPIRNDDSIKTKYIQLLKYANKDTIYAAEVYKGKLYKILYRNNTLTVVGITNMPGVINSASVIDGEFWIHASELSITTNYKKQIANQNITSITKDLEGNYWYSSLKNGVLFELKYNSTSIIKPSYVKKDDFVTCIAQQGNYIIEGTSMGDVYYRKVGQDYSVKKIVLSQTRGGINSIFKLGGTKFLIVSLSNFYIVNVATGSITPYYSVNAIKNFAFYHDAAFIANNEHLALMQFSRKSKPKVADWATINKLFDIPIQYQKTNINLNRRVKNVCFDSINKVLYVNFVGELCSISKKGVQVITYKNKPIVATSIVYKNGKIYIGTVVNGLLILKNGTVVKELTAKSGLSANTVIKLRLCNNRLWLLNSGLVQILDTKTDKLVSNIPLPGLLGSFVYDVAEINNEAYLTTADGIFKVQLNNYNSNAHPINYLTTVVANQKDTLPLIVGYIASEKTKTIEFTADALWYADPKNVYFKYRLFGSNDNTWQTAPSTQRTFNFTGLAPGKYEFQAVSINGIGIASTKPIIYSFSIKKPWWQQWWLYLIILAVIIDIVYLAVQERIDTIKKQNDLLVETIKLQSEVRNSMLTAIKSQMNPHFIFNALNTIQSFIYSNDKSKANSYLGKFSNLIRIVLDSSSKRIITLTEEIEMLQLYIDLEVMRFENTLNATIVIDPSIDTESIFIPPMLIQPFVENAIKHGLLHKINNRKLSISLNLSPTKHGLDIEVDDNGIGRERSAFLNAQKTGEHNSFAIKANQTRIDILNQLSTSKIVLEIIDKKSVDGVVKGTTVKLFIPNELLV